MAKPLVAVVGRPNVGKSTFFNKIAGRRISIVEDTPGVTRDRIYADFEWLNHKFTLIDTGGIEPRTDDILLKQMRRQAEIAIETCDVILFFTDGRAGLTADDEDVATMLRRSHKPVILVVNKVDFQEMSDTVYDFYALGLGEPFPISSTNMLGLGDLLDEMVSRFPEDKDSTEEDEHTIQIAVVGRPNVGKSSLLNALLREERAIVSQYAGTTRDVIEEQLLLDGVPLVLADTAGIRATDDFVEKIGVEKSRQLLADSELVICVIDGSDGLTDEDEAILEAAAGKPCVVIVNKSDLPQQVDLAQLRERFGADKVMTLSAKTLVGIEAFTAWLKSYVYGSKGTLGDGAYIQNARQECLLREALAGLQDAEFAAQDYLPYDCIVIDVRSAIDLLGEITGDTVQDEIINEIFERFCIGK